MMNDPADTRFLSALQLALADSDDPDCERCSAAVNQALATGAPPDLRAARISMDSLPDQLRDRIMAQVHARMASDLSAIWDLMPGAPRTRRPN